MKGSECVCEKNWRDRGRADETVHSPALPKKSFSPTMAASIHNLDEIIRRLSRNDTTLSILDLDHNQVGAEEARRLAEALTTNSTLTTLDLRYNKVGSAGARRVAEALATNSALTEVTLDWDLKTGRLVNAHLDRNKGNLKKKSASLFLMLLPTLLLNDDKPC